MSLFVACSGRGDIDLSKATPLGVEPTSDSGSAGSGVPGKLFTFQPGQQISFKVLADGTEVGGSPIINDFDGDGMDNTDEITTNIWSAEIPQITTRVVTPVTMQVEALSYQTGLTDLKTYSVSGSDLNGEKSTSSERFYRQTLSWQAAQFEKFQYPSGVPSGQVSDFVTPGLGYFSLVGQSSGYNNGSSWAAYSQVSPLSVINIDGGFAADVNVFNWVFKDDFSANAAAQYRIWKREKEANSYQIGSNAGTVRIAMYIKNSGSNVPVRLSNILAALVFETRQGGLVTAANFRLRDVSLANLYSLEMNANTEFGPYLIEVPNISTDLIEKAIRDGYTPQIRLLDYELTHPTNSPYRLSLNFTGDNLKVMDTNAKGRTAKINIIGPAARQTYQVAAFATSTENATDACAPVSAPDASSTASPGVPLTRALDRAACSMAVGGKVGGVPVIEYEQYVLDFTGVPVYDNLNPKIVYVNGIKRIGDVVNNVNCDAAYTNVCYVRFSEYLSNPNNNFAIWSVFAKGKYFNYSQFDYINTSGSGTVRGYPSGSFNSNTRTGSIPRLKGVNSTIWAGDQLDVVYMKVSDILAMRAEPGGTPMESGITLSFNTKWDNSTVGNDPYAPNVHSKFIGKALTGDKIELTFQLNEVQKLNYDFGSPILSADKKTYSNFDYNLQTLSQRFNLQQALQFEVSMALGAERSDWVKVLDTSRLAPCNRNTQGNPDVTVDYVAQRFKICFIVPKGDRSYLPPVTAGDYTDTTLYSLYVRPRLLDEFRNVIWPEKRTEVRRFKAFLNRDYAAGTLVLEVRDAVGQIAANDTFTLGADTTVYTVASTQAIANQPNLMNVVLNSGLAFSHKADDKLRPTDPAVAQSQVNLDISNTYYADWNSYISGLSAYVSNSLCMAVAKDCDFFVSTQDPHVTPGAMSLEYAKDNVNWVGHNLFSENVYDYQALDASRYSTLMGLDLERLVQVPGSSPISYLGFRPRSYVYAPAGTGEFAVGSLLNVTQDPPEIAVGDGKAVVVWSYLENGTNYVVRARFYDLVTSSPIGSDFRVNSTEYTNCNSNIYSRAPRVAITSNRVIVLWPIALTNSGNQSIHARIYDLATGLPLGNDFAVSTQPINLLSNDAPQIAVDQDRALAIWTSAVTPGATYEVRGRFLDLTTGLVSGPDFPISTTPMPVAAGTPAKYFRAAASGSKAIIVWHYLDYPNTSRYYHRARVLDMTTGQFAGGEIALGENNSVDPTGGALGQINIPRVAASDSVAIVAWPKWSSASTVGVVGRLVDLTSGTATAAEWQISEPNSPGGSKSLIKVTPTTGGFLVAWNTPISSLNQGWVRYVAANGAMPHAARQVSAADGMSYYIYDVLGAQDSNLILLQRSNLAGTTSQVLIQTLGNASDLPLISSHQVLTSPTVPPTKYGSALGLWQKKGIAAWLSYGAHPGVDTQIGARFFDLVPLYEHGLNNFFTAPMLKATYTAKASLK